MPDLRRGFYQTSPFNQVCSPANWREKQKWMNDGNEGNIAEGKKVHSKNMQFAWGFYRLCRTYCGWCYSPDFSSLFAFVAIIGLINLIAQKMGALRSNMEWKSWIEKG
jgi:hypothetical protein